jgi:hypothetical protein
MRSTSAGREQRWTTSVMHWVDAGALCISGNQIQQYAFSINRALRSCVNDYVRSGRVIPCWEGA